MFKDIVIGIWESISGFFGGIINAFANNPEVAIPVTIGIVLTVLLSVLGLRN